MHDLFDVSVIIPTRNRAAVLPTAIESLLNQSYPADRFEVLVVNDGSSDATAELAGRYEEMNRGRVRYLPKEHSGLNASRNLGIAEARGVLIAFVDDDIVASSGWLRALVDGASRNPSAECFAGRILLQLEGPVPRTCGHESIGESELDLGEHEYEVDRAWGANFAITRSAIERIGTFNETLPLYGDETEWQHRLRKSGGRIVYLPQASVVHRRTAADLRPMAMLRRRYKMGKSWPLLAPYLERHVSFAGGIWVFLSGVGHALRRGCWVGVLRAAYGIGHATSAASLLMSRERSRCVAWLPRRSRSS